MGKIIDAPVAPGTDPLSVAIANAVAAGGGATVDDATVAALPSVSAKAEDSRLNAGGDIATAIAANTSGLAAKADVTALAAKADVTALAGKADNTALAAKADDSRLNVGGDIGDAVAAITATGFDVSTEATRPLDGEGTGKAIGYSMSAQDGSIWKWDGTTFGVTATRPPAGGASNTDSTLAALEALTPTQIAELTDGVTYQGSDTARRFVKSGNALVPADGPVWPLALFNTGGVPGKGDKAADTASIQEALDFLNARGGGVLQLPDAVTLLIENPVGSGALLQYGDNTTIRGSSSTIVKIADGTDDTDGWLRVFGPKLTSALRNVRFEGFVIDGNRDNLGTLANTEQHHGILVNGEGAADFESVVVADMTIINCHGDGVLVAERGTNVVIKNNVVENCARVGVSVARCLNLIVSGNIVSSPDGTLTAGIKAEVNGVAGQALGDYVFTGNVVTAPVGIAVAGLDSTNRINKATIVGNTVTATALNINYQGILAGNAKAVAISGNVVTGHLRSIKTNLGVEAVNITANVIDGQQTDVADSGFSYGINIGPSTGTAIPTKFVLISSNTIVGVCSGIGVHAAGGSIPEVVDIIGNQVSSRRSALEVYDAVDVTVKLNRFTSTGDDGGAPWNRVAWIRDLAGTAIDCIDISNNVFIGQAPRLTLATTLTNVSLVHNRFKGPGGTNVSGTPVSIYRMDADGATTG